MFKMTLYYTIEHTQYTEDTIIFPAGTNQHFFKGIASTIQLLFRQFLKLPSEKSYVTC